MANPAPGFEVHPNHTVEIEPSEDTVQIHLHGVMIAEGTGPMLLQEAGYKPVYYLPREHVKMDLATLTDHTTYCPFKGHATYFSFEVGGKVAVNAAWSYEDPFDEAIPIKGAIAFDANRIDGLEVL